MEPELPPNTYYKFFNNKWSAEFAKKLELYFSSINQFNDPHDTPLHLIQVKERYTELEIRSILRSFIKNTKTYRQQKKMYMDGHNRVNFPQHMNQLFADLRGKQGVCCLTRELGSAVMWSHYTNHKGIAVKFENLGFALKNFTYVDMKYTEDPISVPLDNNLKSNLITVMGTKSKEWDYEQETRAITEVIGPVKIEPNSVAAVYFGYKCSHEFITGIHRDMRKTLTAYKLQSMPDFFKMEPDRNSFKLKAEPIRIHS